LAFADLLERERIVAEEGRVHLGEGERRLRGLAVALDRGCLPVAGRALVAHCDVDDVGVIGCVPRDDEGLGELQADDPGLDLHGVSLPRHPSVHWRRERP
jgi:hypothetical protein